MSILEVFSPYDLSKIGEVKKHSFEEVHTMMNNAYELFHDEHSKLKPYQRIEILNRLIDLLKQEQESFSELISKEGGKPWIDSSFEASRAISGITSAIAQIHTASGKEVPMELTPHSTNRIAFTIKEPIGVVMAVSAFNHPLNLLIHQIIPAIATGCPIIIKPASTTPMTCIKLVDLIHKAGLPPLYCQVAICDSEITNKIISSPKIAFFSFIGSGAVGWKLVKNLAPGTRFALEHGGVAPVIIDKEVDIENIIPKLAKGAFYHAGQVCVSTKKIYIHDNIAEEFVNKFALYVTNLKVGNPLEKDTDIGPLILPKEVDRVESWVNKAVEEGAVLMSGGKKLSKSTYSPTILYNPSEHSIVSKEEIFGPVVCVYSYKDRLEAIQKANALPYSFQAAVFSNNINFAIDTAKRLNAANVVINDHSAYRADWMPFGGRKESGFGSGGIVNSIHDLLQDKLMIINFN